MWVIGYYPSSVPSSRPAAARHSAYLSRVDRRFTEYLSN